MKRFIYDSKVASIALYVHDLDWLDRIKIAHLSFSFCYYCCWLLLQPKSHNFNYIV